MKMSSLLRARYPACRDSGRGYRQVKDPRARFGARLCCAGIRGRSVRTEAQDAGPISCRLRMVKILARKPRGLATSNIWGRGDNLSARQAIACRPRVSRFTKLAERASSRASTKASYRASDIFLSGCPGAHADANHGTLLPFGTTNPAFTTASCIWVDRGPGNRLVFAGYQQLVEDDLVQNFEALLLQVRRRIDAYVQMQAVDQVIDTRLSPRYLSAAQSSNIRARAGTFPAYAACRRAARCKQYRHRRPAVRIAPAQSRWRHMMTPLS